MEDFTSAFLKALMTALIRFKRFVFAGPISTLVLLLTVWATFKGGEEMLMQLLGSRAPNSIPATVDDVAQLLTLCAAFLGAGLLFLSSAVVSSTRSPGHPDARYHVALAWSSGLLGTFLLFLEVIGLFEYHFEDLLLAASGVNMLVKELSERAGHAY